MPAFVVYTSLKIPLHWFAVQFIGFRNPPPPEQWLGVDELPDRSQFQFVFLALSARLMNYLRAGQALLGGPPSRPLRDDIERRDAAAAAMPGENTKGDWRLRLIGVERTEAVTPGQPGRQFFTSRVSAKHGSARYKLEENGIHNCSELRCRRFRFPHTAKVRICNLSDAASEFLLCFRSIHWTRQWIIRQVWMSVAFFCPKPGNISVTSPAVNPFPCCCRLINYP